MSRLSRVATIDVRITYIAHCSAVLTVLWYIPIVRDVFRQMYLCVQVTDIIILQINMHYIWYNNMVIDLISISPKFHTRFIHTSTRTY